MGINQIQERLFGKYVKRKSGITILIDGMTQSSKRWLSGPKGNQTEHIRINIPTKTKM